MTPLALAILISGRGTNMEALIRAAQAPDYPARACLVISNRPDAGGLETARGLGVDTVTIDHKPYAQDRQAFESRIDSELVGAGIEIVALAGFMRILTPWFVDRWRGRMVNVHPSLLPKYPGLHTHRRALEAGDTEHGCSVHWVTAGVDEGDVIQQARVPVIDGDDEATLAARVQKAEHVLYPQAVAKACREIFTRKR